MKKIYLFLNDFGGIMKIREIISKLKEFDPETEVICYREREDETITNNRNECEAFDIIHIEKIKAEKMRLPNQSLNLKFGISELAKDIVILDISNK